MRKVIIIGSGCAGYTAAMYTARANLSPLLITGVQIGGQLMLTTEIENFPGFPEGISGAELMEKMRSQSEKFGTEIWMDSIEKINFSRKPFTIVTSNGKTETAETVIISTGASAKWLGLESEKRLMGKGVSACAVCDGAFFRGKEVALVGGGDVAMEDAAFLTKFASKVNLIHRRQEFRASKIMQERVRNHPKIKFVLDSIVVDILGDQTVTGVKIQNLKSKIENVIPCQGFFVAIGHEPNTKIFEGQIQLDEKGYIITDDRTQTNVSGVFACGDVTDHRYRQAVSAAGSGCKAALEAEKFLETERGQ